MAVIPPADMILGEKAVTLAELKVGFLRQIYKQTAQIVKEKRVQYYRTFLDVHTEKYK